MTTPPTPHSSRASGVSPVTRAWAILLALSAASTGLAASGIAGAGLSLSVLVLAGMKARVILGAYLGLASAPSWQRGFDLTLGLFLAVLAVLAIAA
ncbi:MAG: cytochrome C oxidase subunit IV family protein [Paracoccaceae bacterium]